MTVKETLLSAGTVALAGWVTMTGGNSTVSVAIALVMLPELLVTMTE